MQGYDARDMLVCVGTQDSCGVLYCWNEAACKSGSMVYIFGSRAKHGTAKRQLILLPTVAPCELYNETVGGVVLPFQDSWSRFSLARFLPVEYCMTVSQGTASNTLKS